MSNGADDHLVALYERHADDLRRVRAEQRALYERSGYSSWQRFFAYRWIRTSSRRLGLDWERKRFMNPQLDDVEAELTYLLIRERRPATVVEISPFRGWSTTWILHALRDNGAGELVSYDLVDDSLRFVPAELAERWRLVTGDVRRRLDEIPEAIDYLFLDSDHRRAFAEWYIAELFPRLVPGAGVSIHDVFHGRAPGRGSGEARVVLDWLELQGLDRFTASRFGPTRTYERLHEARTRLGLDAKIHTGKDDSMVFFEISD